jgi:hypothetical protein
MAAPSRRTFIGACLALLLHVSMRCETKCTTRTARLAMRAIRHRRSSERRSESHRMTLRASVGAADASDARGDSNRWLRAPDDARFRTRRCYCLLYCTPAAALLSLICAPRWSDCLKLLKTSLIPMPTPWFHCTAMPLTDFLGTRSDAKMRQQRVNLRHLCRSGSAQSGSF